MSDFSIYLFFSFYVFASSCKTQIKDQFSITSAGHQGSPIICGTNAVALLFYRLDIEILLKHIFINEYYTNYLYISGTAYDSRYKWIQLCQG